LPVVTWNLSLYIIAQKENTIPDKALTKGWRFALARKTRQEKTWRVSVRSLSLSRIHQVAILDSGTGLWNSVPAGNSSPLQPTSPTFFFGNIGNVN
jgi:hypothetical protein